MKQLDELEGLKRRRVRQVFTYLKALDAHRNPAKRQIAEQPWSFPLNGLPRHSSIKLVYPVEEGNKSEGASVDGSPILRVSRPALSEPPKPATEHEEWIDGEWHDPFALPRLVPVKTRLVANQVVEEEIGAARQRTEALQRWLETWRIWAENERPARLAMKEFERLYELHGRMAREGDELELVFGDGLLNWHLPDGGIHHPILLQPCELQFDPTVPEFRVVEGDAPVEFYSGPLLGSEVGGAVLSQLRQELLSLDLSPFEGSGTSAFLKSLVTRLHPMGQFVGEPPGNELDFPRICRQPVLFLRSRSLGYAAALDSVLEDIREGAEILDPIAGVVGLGPAIGSEGEDSDLLESVSEPAEVLLSSPANPEQIRVMQRLNLSDSVVVQGPPGTGKTHTIANLIGHLLAQGKSILVTSHTAKALTVLRDKVSEPLRSLCVSVLGNDVESRKQLETSIQAMLERVNRSSSAFLERKAEQHLEVRAELLGRLADLRQRLVNARSDEYRPLTFLGKSWSPADAARMVARELADHGWIPGPVIPGGALPLSQEEVRQLYGTNQALSAADESDLRFQLPPLEEIPSPAVVGELARHRAALAHHAPVTGAGLWARPADPEEQVALEELQRNLESASREISGLEKPWRFLVELSFHPQEERLPWDRLVKEVRELRQLRLNHAESRYRWAPEFSTVVPIDEQLTVAEEMVAHLDKGGKIDGVTGLLRPRWMKLRRSAKVGGRRPRTKEHLQVLAAELRLALYERRVIAGWQRQAESFGLPAAAALGEPLDLKLNELSDQIGYSLGWYALRLTPLLQELVKHAFVWERFDNGVDARLTATPSLDRVYDQLRRLSVITADRIRDAQSEKIRRLHKRIVDTIGALRRRGCDTPLLNELESAIVQVDLLAYENAYERLRRLLGKREIAAKREELLTRLSESAKAWALAVRERQGIHGAEVPPGDPERAWELAQVRDELERRSSVSLEELSKRLKQDSDELRRVTVEMIELRAWAAQARRVDRWVRQALVEWQDLVRRTPRSSSVPGKLSRLRRAAREAMRQSRVAVPVWIMPLHRVVENFDFRKTRFDVVIIDEASQADALGLLAYYIARKVMVVGDHEQVSPLAVGQKDSVVSSLIGEHLQGIPLADLYDGRMSVYDVARASSGESICLVEHFRCVPQIIQFSNDLSYGGRIKPLRESSAGRVVPSLIPYRVQSAGMHAKINQDEAEVVASLVVAAIEQPEFRDLSIGVISMVGEQQALEIDRLLRANLPVDLYDRHQIVCGNPPHFQGDERDVIFLSVVSAPEGGPLARRDQPQDRQRFNVAASRARDQLWVVYSVDPQTDLKPGDLRRRLIEHALDPGALERKFEAVEASAESEFERLVGRLLVDRGYRVRTQYPVGHYRIDLLVEGGNGKRLAVECDGDRYHTLENLREDMARQVTLERLGLQFVRVRGSRFFRDPDEAMRPVFSALARLGIEPAGNDPVAECKEESELLTRIRARAQQLLSLWHEIACSPRSSRALPGAN